MAPENIKVSLPIGLLIPKWDWLRPIGTSLIARAAILLPVVAYLILLSPHVVELARIDPRFSFLSSDRPWRLVFTYYGLALTGLSALAFTVMCPPQIKQDSSATGHAERQIALVMASAQRRQMMLVGASAFLRKHTHTYHLDPEMSALAEYVRKHREGQLSLDEQRTAFGWLLIAVWNDANTSRAWARTLVVALFAGGVFFLSIPTVWTFYEVSAWLLSGMPWPA